jgi:hypothetical protein
MITVTTKVHFSTTKAGRKRMHPTAGPTLVASPGRIPRISRLMALAIRFDRLLRDGKVADQSELARLARVTQPRMTQIMNLNHLAPDIQEQLLFLSSAQSGREPIHERLLRIVAAQVCWAEQRYCWCALSRANTNGQAAIRQGTH